MQKQTLPLYQLLVNWFLIKGRFCHFERLNLAKCVHHRSKPVLKPTLSEFLNVIFALFLHIGTDLSVIVLIFFSILSHATGVVLLKWSKDTNLLLDLFNHHHQTLNQGGIAWRHYVFLNLVLFPCVLINAAYNFVLPLLLARFLFCQHFNPPTCYIKNMLYKIYCRIKDCTTGS